MLLDPEYVHLALGRLGFVFETQERLHAIYVNSKYPRGICVPKHRTIELATMVDNVGAVGPELVVKFQDAYRQVRKEKSAFKVIKSAV